MCRRPHTPATRTNTHTPPAHISPLSPRARTHWARARFSLPHLFSTSRSLPPKTLIYTQHVIVPDEKRVSEVISEQRRTESGETATIELTPGVVLAIEADCNLGKSYAVFNCLIRPILEAVPHTPLLFWSVRITHAYDLHETLKNQFMQGDSAIPGVKIECYKEGKESVTSRVGSSSARPRPGSGFLFCERARGLALDARSECNRHLF